MQTVKNIGVMSLGKLMGIVYGVLGLLFMPFFLIAGGLAMFQANEGHKMAAVGSLVIAVLFPVLYGAVGFIGGIIGAFVYNLASRYVGGIQIELAPPSASTPI
jgi:hypothetical protein